MSESFKSTREIWEWLLEKPEVNRIIDKHGNMVFLNSDGFVNQPNWILSYPDQWSKHVELPKVTISREDLAIAWNENCGHLAKTHDENGRIFANFCKRVGL